MAERITSRDYRNPYRPFPLSQVNAAGRLFIRLGLKRPFQPGTLVRDAAKSAGLSPDYVGEDLGYHDGLEVLCGSIEKEARLNPLGRLIIRGRITSALRARFRAEGLMKNYVKLESRVLAPPVLITGLQRTGTTLLHRLMAADRRIRSLRSWEVLDPVPPAPGKADPRIKATRRAERAAAWMAPDFFAVHPIDHQAPEEDVLLLDNSFLSTVAEAIIRVPSYAAWLEEADSTPAYEFMRRLLLLLQTGEDPEAWILKSPHHLEFLDVLFKVFPEVKVIQTHRDPGKTMGSFLSMVAHGYGMFTDAPDPGEIADHWTRKCKRMTEKGREFRESLDPAFEQTKFLDVQFADLIIDPIAVLRDIYAFIDLEFDDEAERDAKAVLATHGRHRFGRHVYNLSDFQHSETAVRDDFADYIRAYSVPIEE